MQGLNYSSGFPIIFQSIVLVLVPGTKSDSLNPSINIPSELVILAENY